MTEPTDDEVQARAEAWDVSAQEARFILAIERGEIDGDVLVLDEGEEPDEEAGDNE